MSPCPHKHTITLKETAVWLYVCKKNMVTCSESNEPTNADGRGYKFEVIGLSTVTIVC